MISNFFIQHLINFYYQVLYLQKQWYTTEEFFSQFPDPRNRWVYPAWFLILIILCGYLCGCNTIAAIAHFAEVKNKWLNQLLGLDFKPVSYDTIWWFLVRVKPDPLQSFMITWLKSLPVNLKNQVLALDGKRLRGVSDNDHVTHLVELFASESRLTIVQEKVPDKKGERKALPKLLKDVDVDGAIISMDTHYTYKPELKQVLDSGADYIVGIKGNQGTLHAEVVNYFTQAHAINYDSEEFECHTTLDKEHGRLETRQACVSCDLEWLNERESWGLQTLIEIRSKREIGG